MNIDIKDVHVGQAIDQRRNELGLSKSELVAALVNSLPYMYRTNFYIHRVNFKNDISKCAKPKCNYINIYMPFVQLCKGYIIWIQS